VRSIEQRLDDILEFEAAIDQINGAGCNSPSLAGDFDNPQLAGRLGNAFNPFPELGPAFTILAQDQNFFSTVLGELHPEQRWADEFQNVDGYIPNWTQ
jgi:hypothetical protein